MAYVLRLIRRGRWLPQEQHWFREGDFQADCLSDLNTSDNTLSLWSVKDDRSNLESIAVALASTRDSFANVDYAIIPEEMVRNFGILVPTEGKSPHRTANENWHRDLCELSSSRLIELARVFLQQGEKNRIAEKQIIQLLKRAAAEKEIDLDAVKVTLRSHL